MVPSVPDVAFDAMRSERWKVRSTFSRKPSLEFNLSTVHENEVSMFECLKCATHMLTTDMTYIWVFDEKGIKLQGGVGMSVGFHSNLRGDALVQGPRREIVLSIERVSSD